MRMFVIEASEGTVRLILRACQEVRIQNTNFNVEELLSIKDIITCLKEELAENDHENVSEVREKNELLGEDSGERIPG